MSIGSRIKVMCDHSGREWDGDPAEVVTFICVNRSQEWVTRTQFETDNIDAFRHPRREGSPRWGSTQYRRVASPYGSNRISYGCACGITLEVGEPLMFRLLNGLEELGVSNTTLHTLNDLVSSVLRQEFVVDM